MSKDLSETLITPAQEEEARTQVDLGDDLLQLHLEEELPARGQDDFESAKILYDEGFIEQAKKLLRKLLIDSPSDSDCQKLLDQIQQEELENLLEEQSPSNGSSEDAEFVTDLNFDTRQILSDLDRDFDLGLMPSLFSEAEAMAELGPRLDVDLAESTPELRVDLGIAFLEMGLFDLAIRHFRAAVDRFALDDEDSRISATSLLGFALLQSGRAFEATEVIQPWLAESDVPLEKKIDLFYLMGRSLESLENWDEAKTWYMEVSRHDSDYRDVHHRLHSRQGQGKGK